MNSAALRSVLGPAAVLLAVTAVPALAQRPPSPEQRVAVLEQQLAASQAAAIRLEQRLNAIEQQLQQLINQGEVNGNRAATLEADMSRLRSDLEGRMTALENRPVQAQAAQSVAADEPPATRPKPEVQTAAAAVPDVPGSSSAESEPSDPGEDAYSEGFRLWRDGKYAEAVQALRAFVAEYPKHRRVSFARNLIGRALLDDGKPRPAAEALLANYRADPKGERAADSLYYLGQALIQLGQPSQACKAYAELEDVYGSSVRADLRSLLTKGKAEANCS